MSNSELFMQYLSCADPDMSHNPENIGKIKVAVSQLRSNYDHTNDDRNVDQDFNQAELRSAYLYMYSTAVTYMVMDVLEKRNSHIRNLIQSALEKKKPFNVTSLGSGPGSDLVGVKRFLKDLGETDPASFVFNGIEKYDGWRDVFSRVMAKFHCSASNFIKQDLSTALSEEAKLILAKTDLLLIVKFFSANNQSDLSLDTLKDALRLLPKGALVLLIDNSGGNAYYHARDVCEERCRTLYNSYNEVLFKDNYTFQIPPYSEPNMNPIYGDDPQRKSGIAYTMFQV